MSRMIFDVSTLGYIQQSQSITLDYAITINNLKEKDQLFNGGALGNFSLAGFELVRRDRRRSICKCSCFRSLKGILCPTS